MDLTTDGALAAQGRGVTPTNHGQFNQADQLVSAVHRAEGGIFDGFRAAHAFGRFYAGTLTATPAAKTISHAAHFQGTPVPVTARLSGASGDPSTKREKLMKRIVGLVVGAAAVASVVTHIVRASGQG